MKMNLPKTLLAVFIATIMIFGVQSCIDDEKFDLNNRLVTDIELSGGVAAPIAHGSYTIADFLEERPDTLIYDQDADSLIKIVYNEDSIYSFSFDDFYETPEVPEIEKSFDLGAVTIPDQTINSTITVQDIADATNSSTLQGLIDSGTDVPVPSFTLEDAGTYDFSAAGDFVSVTYEDGEMVITFTNRTNFPVNLTLDVVNSDNSPLFSGVEFNDVGAGETKTETNSLAGKTMTQQMTATITKFGSDGTGGVPVSVNGDDELFMEAQAQDLAVASGEVNAENIDRTFASDTILEFSAEGRDAELTKVAIESGMMQITINSDLEMDLEMELKMPLTFRNDDRTDTLKKTYAIPANSSSIYELDMTGTATYLSPDSVNYNEVPVSYKVASKQNTGTVSFSSSDQLSITAGMNEFDIDYVKGYFGTDTIAIDEDEFDLDLGFLDNFEGGLTFTDPEFVLNMSNKGIGLPAKLDLMMKGIKDGKEVDLGYDFGMLEIPDALGETVNANYVVDKNSSNIVEMMALPPKKILYGGEAVLNPGEVKYDNFISGDAEANIGFETEIPLAIKTDNLQLTDTLDVDLPKEIKNIETGNLLLDYKNGMPLTIYLTLTPYNSETDTEYDPIQPDDEILLNGAETTNGVAQSPMEGKAKIALNAAAFTNLTEADQLILDIRMATFNGERAEIHANYPVDIKIRVNASGNYKIE